jgi:hypothetical protein
VGRIGTCEISKGAWVPVSRVDATTISRLGAKDPIGFGTLHALAPGMITSRQVRYIGFVVALVLAPGMVPGLRAQSQGIPASLITSAIHDMENRAPVAPAAELPERNPRKAFVLARVNPFSVLAAGVYTASWLDMTETQSFMPHFHEADPFVRPLLSLPKPLYYASGTAFATSLNWLGLKMERSPRWHKICWLPQAISIAGNLGGFAYTRSNSIVTQTSSTRTKTR